MKPVLFTIGGFSVKTYGFMASIGFLVSILIMVWVGYRHELKKEKMIDLCIVTLISCLVGARLLHVLVNYQDFIHQPIKILSVQEGGLVFYGGMIMGTLGCYLWCLYQKIPFGVAADGLALCVCQGHIFGRIGCYFYGCCFGTPVSPDFIFAVKFPGHTTHVHPAMFYEATLLFFIFLILVRHINSAHRHGTTFILYVCLYALARFSLEFLRGDERGSLLGLLSTSQVIAILTFSLALFILYKLRTVSGQAESEVQEEK